MGALALRCAAAALLTVASASAQPVAGDSLPGRLPPTVAAPSGSPQASAARAYVYSLAATGGLVGLGVLTEHAVDAASDDDVSALRGIGYVVGLAGVLVGPAVGNVSLGAGADLETSTTIKMVGVGSGFVIPAVGFVATLACYAASGEAEACGDVLRGSLTLGRIALVGGLAAGAAYDLATIPRNAERAHQMRPVTVGPGLRQGHPTLSVRVGL